MAGFEWNTFYTHFEKKMKKEYPKCKVGRYITPKQADFPYCDVALSVYLVEIMIWKVTRVRRHQ